MNQRNRHLRAVLAAGLAFAAALSLTRAQNAPTPSATATAQDPVQLDPFQVNADSDVGFVAASSLAGARLATPLKDTPVSYSVITSEFLQAFNSTDVVKATEFGVNTVLVDGDGSQRNFARPAAAQVYVRGVKITRPQRNFFWFNYTADNYNVDRVDLARGPNAVLFGAGTAGGMVNTITKKALPAREVRDLHVQAGSYNKLRATADVNQPVTDKWAVRVNAMYDQGDTWRDYEWTKKQGVHLASTYQFTPSFSVSLDGEVGRNREKKWTMLQDQVSGWDGTTTQADAPASPSNNFLRSRGLAVRTTRRWVLQPDWGADPQNTQNTLITTGARYFPTLAQTSVINGRPIRTVDMNLSGTPMIDVETGIPDTARFTNVIAGSPGFHIPQRRENLLWGGDELPTYSEESRSGTLTFNYKLGDSLFLELAGNVNAADIMGNTNVRRGLTEFRIDLLENQPNGGANPNFLRPYGEMMEYRTLADHTFENYRFQSAYVKETRIGKLQAGVMAGHTDHEEVMRGKYLLLPLTSVYPDARGWVGTGRPDQNELGLYSRFYFDGPRRNHDPRTLERPMTLTDPVTGISETVTPTWLLDAPREDRIQNNYRRYRFVQGALNFDLFKNKLVVIGAIRRDWTYLWQERILHPADLPTWDGRSMTLRPSAPADYWSLKFSPKDDNGNIIGPESDAVTRPRQRDADGVARALPQYANDRFQDDYNLPRLNNQVNTHTVGLVYNLKPWLGLYANVSRTFDLSDPLPLIDGTVGKPTPALGKDAGVRITLPNGKLSMSLGVYDAYQEGLLIVGGYGISGHYTRIAAAPVVGDLQLGSSNQRGLTSFQFDPRTTVTRSTKGAELELTANFTRNWRLMLNAGYTQTEEYDAHKEIKAYIPEKDSLVRQVLADAGVRIGSDNVAFIDPAVDNPALIQQDVVQRAVDAWNEMQTESIPNIFNERPKRGFGMAPWVANLATDYRFSSGPLSGLRLGLGVNYRHGAIVGYRASDTIVDPNNPAVAIDDPTVDETTPVYGSSYFKTTATLSYTWTLRDARSLRLDFFVDNLLDERGPIYGHTGIASGSGATTLVPRDGDWTSPARKTVPGNFSYQIPRNYTLSATLSF